MKLPRNYYMLRFEPYSLEALRRAEPYIRRNRSLCSDLAVGSLILWHEGINMQFGFRNDTFVLRQDVGDQPAFYWPIGRDVDGMIDALLVYTKEQRLPLRFFAADEETLEKILGDPRLLPAAWSYDRRWSDYIYSFEEALTFPGRKYAGQRNHINKFKKLYGAPKIRFLTPEDGPALKRMLSEYDAEHAARNSLESHELKQAEELIRECPEFNLPAAVLEVEGEIAAVSVGEIIGEMLLIHVEKALTRFPGIYPTMYSGFVNLVAEKLGRPLTYVNREDDSGDPGLRISKMQYHPVRMEHKRVIHVHSPAAGLGPLPQLQAGHVVLTAIRESDKPAYMSINMDVENNRFWGYDYREDMMVTGPESEDLFYDSLMFDMQAGDSINFAIRQSADGEMIGEAVLWNFGEDGSAELGLRLIPSVHGKGYGREAYTAAADYAEKVLGLRVWARCYPENEASRKMILGSRFRQVSESGAFLYFEREPEDTVIS